MDVTPQIDQGVNVIQSYTADSLMVGKTTYKAPVIITADKIAEGDDLSQINKPEVLLIASDEAVSHEDFLKYKDMADGFEIMNVDAACRTYNVLITEGRKVAIMLT